MRTRRLNSDAEALTEKKREGKKGGGGGTHYHAGRSLKITQTLEKKGGVCGEKGRQRQRGIEKQRERNTHRN